MKHAAAADTSMYAQNIAHLIAWALPLAACSTAASLSSLLIVVIAPGVERSAEMLLLLSPSLRMLLSLLVPDESLSFCATPGAGEPL